MRFVRDPKSVTRNMAVMVVLAIASFQSAWSAETSPVATNADWLNRASGAYNIVLTELNQLKESVAVAPSVATTYFPTSDFYESVVVPVLSAKGSSPYQVELVGQFYDRNHIYLLNVQQDSPASAWFNHYGRSSGFGNKDLAVGMGASYSLDQDVAIQALFSTGDLPNYGDSNMAVGISLKF